MSPTDTQHTDGDPFLAWATRDLAERSGITLEEARRIVVATYVTDAAPDRAELEEGPR